MSIVVHQIDAFTDEAFGGNPGRGVPSRDAAGDRRGCKTWRAR